MDKELIIKDLAKELNLNINVIRNEFEDFYEKLKRNRPSMRDTVYLKHLKQVYLGRIVNYDDNGAGWTMKVKNIYYNRNELIFEGSGIDWTDSDSDGITGMIISKNMRRVVDESMVDEFEIYDMGDVERMIADMADMVITEAQALMED